MRILYIGESNKSGMYTGPQMASESIYAEAVHADIDSRFISFYEGDVKNSLKEKIFGGETEMPSGKKPGRLGIIRFIKLMYTFRPDIIHLVTFHRYHLLPLLFRFIKRVKIIYNVNGIAVYENGKLSGSLPHFYFMKDRIIESLLFTFADRLIFHSKCSLNKSKIYHRSCERKHRIIPHGVNSASHFSKKRNNHNIPLKALTAANCGYPLNGLNFLIDSIIRYKIPVDLTVVGDEKNMLNFKHDGRIVLMNKLNHSDFINKLSDYELYICPSEHESFSITALEAMSAGLVPVLTSGTGLSEYLHDAENGFIFEYGDGKTLAQIINLLTLYPDTRSAVSRGAIEFARNFSWGSVFHRSYLPLYEELIKQ